MEALLLRFDAPLMSFGAVRVDQHNVTERFPSVSLVAGLLGNALGWDHKDADALQALQARLVVASRWDIEPELLIDYDTADLGQPKMRFPGWTTRGAPEHREGGPDARFGTHRRLRHYWANGVLTLVMALPALGRPDLTGLEHALRSPARPLFIGRKTCLPSAPILLGRDTDENVLEILARVPRAQRPGRQSEGAMPARWPAELGAPHAAQISSVSQHRDWQKQWHAGTSLVAEGLIMEHRS